jgi:hypothetical protein
VRCRQQERLTRIEAERFGVSAHRAGRDSQRNHQLPALLTKRVRNSECSVTGLMLWVVSIPETATFFGVCELGYSTAFLRLIGGSALFLCRNWEMGVTMHRGLLCNMSAQSGANVKGQFDGGRFDLDHRA